MNRVELVFRSVGERTTELALELARRNLGPTRVHVARDIKPFWKAFQHNLAIDFDCDYVVFVDADSLILEDMRPYLDALTDPYVDCYVVDKFRGRLHAGVHITSIEVVEAMRRQASRTDDPDYLIRPESYTRMHAMRELGYDKTLRNFRILHDFAQSYEDIFAKYLLREIRSRNEFEWARLETCVADWPEDDDDDFRVARRALTWSRQNLSDSDITLDVGALIPRIPEIARREVADLGLKDKPPVDANELDRILETPRVQQQMDMSSKIFSLGLSRTGTKSLTRALNVLGYVMVHYPTDAVTYRELSGGNYRLTLLDHVDGITDITVAPYYRELDKIYPGSKFILTVRNDMEAWLASLERHWDGKPIYDDIPDQGDVLRMKRFLRAAVYGTFAYSRDRLASVYELHVAAVRDYFKDRPGDLLEMDITAGDGWEPLCEFFDKPVPEVVFPNVQTKLKLREMLSRAV